MEFSFPKTARKAFFKNKLLLKALSGLMILSACDHSAEQKQQALAPAELSKHTEVFEQRIEKVNQNIYVAIGFGLANSILIEGKDSCVIVDCMESMDAGERVRKEFEKVCTKPVKAIIYTHFHTDHTSGAVALAGNSNPLVIAQELLPHYLDQTAAVVRPITEKRSYRMFGVYLSPDELVNCGIGPLTDIHEGSTLGVLRPNLLFKDSLNIRLAGIPMQLFHAPGETPDQLNVWLPEAKVLLCGDNLYKTFPNLYTIRGTPYRDINLWRSSVDRMRYLKPEVIVPSHTGVLRGRGFIDSVLTDYRDAIQYIHDQTVRGMNLGKTPDELAAEIQLPGHLRANPYLYEFYGKTEWSVRSVFSGYLGWFDGNPSSLLPHPPIEKARRMEQLAGGKDALMKALKDADKKGDDRWSLELSDALMLLYPTQKDIKEIRIRSLRRLGEAESNPNARHYFLTMAKELEGMRNEGLIKPTPDLVKTVPIEYVFRGMAAHLNPERSAEVKQKVLFEFTDTGNRWTVEIRRGVAEVQAFDTGNPDITIRVSEQVWKELAAKVRNPAETFLSGEIKIEGGKVALLKFLSLFDLDS